MVKEKIEEVMWLIAVVVLFVFILIGASTAINAQQQTVFVECTVGEYPAEITWQIVTCNGGVLLEGGAPYLGAVVLPEYYQITMRDSYGDGWNGAYLYIDEEEYGFLSDIDWIDSIGTWPQEFKNTTIDIGCLTIGVEEVVAGEFKPTYYYNLLGEVVRPTRGMYIVSDGTLTRKIYIER